MERQARRFNLIEGDLSDVLTDVQSAMAENLVREGFDLTIQADHLPVFAYDREVLVQVLINLMENSVKFGRNLPEKRITIATDTADGWVILTVFDTGPGIPKRALKKVFDEFYRVDGELTRTAGGTGIGLALVKKSSLPWAARSVQITTPGPAVPSVCGCRIEARQLAISKSFCPAFIKKEFRFGKLIAVEPVLYTPADG